MNCPKCKAEEPRQVGWTARPECNIIRWECKKCKHRYTTMEMLADSAHGPTCLSCLFYAADADFCTRHGKKTYIKKASCDFYAKKQIKQMIDYGAYSAIMDALEYAKTKHPVFPADRTGGLAIISEEMLELTQAINDGESNNRCLEEAAQVAATAIRFIENIIGGK